MIWHLARKEIKSLFASPMGWVILALLQFWLGLKFYSGINNYFQVMSGIIRPAERMGVTSFIGQSVFGDASFFMLVAVPLLSMRLISEERKSNTLPFLMTAPMSLTQIVLGKFLGLVAFLSILIVFVLVMLLTLGLWADIDYGYLFSNTLGLWLLVASFCSLGLYFSSLTAQPVVAAIITFIALFGLMIFDRFFTGNEGSIMNYLSMMQHFQPFARGLIDTADIAFFLLFITTFLTLTIRRLDADRLRG